MKPVFWIGDSREGIHEFPDNVQKLIGYALHLAQDGDKHPRARPLHGFRGAGVLEIVDDFAGDTYRAVYTVSFAEIVYVLHVFQKKSTHGIRTARRDIEVIESRLRWARQHYSEWIEQRRTH